MATKLCFLSSLEKVFPDGETVGGELRHGSMLRNEIYSFQLAYTTDEPRNYDAQVKIESPLAEYMTVYAVDCVPSMLPVTPGHDGDYLRTRPGLFPDVLAEFNGTVRVLSGQWHTLWFCVEPKGRVGAGVYPVTVTMAGPEGGEDCAALQIEVIGQDLPPQKLIVTQWFHTDCLAEYYRTPVFGERYWSLAERYLSMAAKYGMNMVLTPVFTPPLDTKVGGERPTVQLVDVAAKHGEYSFGFDRLGRWMELAQRCGIRYFEISHFFTQWGAKSAPKVMATVDGEPRRIFGWETDAGSEEYRSFLRQFLRSLRAYLEPRDLLRKCWFHVSDEPSEEHIDAYRRGKELIEAEMPDRPIIDALSSYKFYEDGTVRKPVVASDHIGPFLEHRVTGLWTYYCCGQVSGVSNRFLAMPSYRNRVLGLQLYKFGIEGFLQWGFNFWYNALSERLVDPYCVTDGLCSWPSGDPFVVYPGKDGPVPSLRLLVFHEAIQDMRALCLLESLSSREEAVRLLEDGLAEPLAFDRYPKSADALLSIRRRVNRRIRELGGN